MLIRKSLPFLGMLTQEIVARKSSEPEYNWQAKGTCGVPSVLANDNLFNAMAARSLGMTEASAATDFQALIVSIHENSELDAEEKLEKAHQAFRHYNRELKQNSLNEHLQSAWNMNGIAYDLDTQRPVRDNQHGRRRRDADNSTSTTAAPTGSNASKEIDARIVGGKQAKKNSWPWQVFVKFGFDCGGALIDEFWVITAAHCINKASLKSAYVRVGAHVHQANNDNVDELGTRIAVDEVIVHESYNSQNFKFDMALLKLKKSAIPKNTDGSPNLKEIAPICLSTMETCFDKRTPCVVTGWGVNDADTWERNDYLSEVAVRLMSTSECTTHSTYKAYFHEESMLCGGWADGGKDACAGDSGGPLVCRVESTDDDRNGRYDNQWVLYGLVSWGLGCAKKGQPGVYTNVPNLSEWVQEKIGVKADKGFNFKDSNGNKKCNTWNQNLEDNWKEDIKALFTTQSGPALSAPGAQHAVEQNEQDNARCDIKAPVLAFNGVDALQDDLYPGHVKIPINSQDEILISPVPNKVFWWAKWTKIDQVYPINQNCSFIFTNTNEEMRIKLTIVRAKIDCAGMTAPKQLRAAGTVKVGDELTVESDTINTMTGTHELGCPQTANVKKTTITMYGSGFMKLKLFTDQFRTQDGLGNDAMKQRWDGSFVAKVSIVPKWSDCIPGITKKEFSVIGERMFLKSPQYPRFYSKDSQCRIHFTVKDPSSMKLVYKILKMELKVRSDTCSADKNDAILWLQNQVGCTNNDIFEAPGVFKEDQLVGQNCGKQRKSKTHTDLGGMNAGCFIFAANGARLNEPSSVRTGRFLLEVKAVDINYQPKTKKKRKKRSLNGMPYGPMIDLDY